MQHISTVKSSKRVPTSEDGTCLMRSIMCGHVKYLKDCLYATNKVLSRRKATFVLGRMGMIPIQKITREIKNLEFKIVIRINVCCRWLEGD